MEQPKLYSPYYQRYYDGVQAKLEEALSDLEPIQQLFELEKLAMKIRKGNSARVYKEALDFSNTHPKIKEESNDYKR